MTSLLFLVTQIINLILLGLWVVLAFKAIRHLSASDLSLSQRGLWLVVILAVPVLGAALYLLTFPSRLKTPPKPPSPPTT
ncbi:MAG: PLDc N-terminal domain-containing protein [Anaerolineales bacterium]|nr:PLDc N-terminal domain-containing protein [Anaerolineales bacterium]MDW8227613.1 PLDc N-terminal domain-containing protein [Anaerolineales bacterium]